MKQMKVALCPMDIAMFRDAKPFELGGYARSHGLPLPSTFSGAVRSLLREKYPDRGELYEEPKWRLRGPFPALVREEGGVRVEELYPLPNDVLKDAKGDLVVPKPAKPYSYKVDGVELLSPPRLKGGEILEPPEENLMDGEALVRYLKGEAIGRSRLRKFDELFGRTERPGVALSYAKVVEPRRFYRVEALEAKREVEGGGVSRAGYAATIFGEDEVVEAVKQALEGERIVRFGGESRPSTIAVMEDSDKKWEEAKRAVAERVSKSGRFKVYLATPAIFGDDDTSRWIPKWLGRKGVEIEGNFMEQGLMVKLKGVSLGRRIRISGWDYKAGCVKRMYIGVPAGSVYYFEIEGNVSWQDVFEKIIDVLEVRNVSDIMPSLGFGTAFVGVW